MTENHATPTARTPEDITRLFVEFSNAGDADAVASLYHDDAVMAYPSGEVTRGRDAIRDLWASVLAHGPTFVPEQSLPTLYFGDDLALTSTPPRDGAGARAQVVARQGDGSWVRIIDQPEFQRPSW
ncbi:YybH family protein [Gordonia sp. NPDC003424]